MTTSIHEPGPYCPERRDEIVDYLFQELGPGALEAFEAHLASCNGCSQEVTSLGGTLLTIQDSSDGAADSSNPMNGAGRSWDEEWTLLRRRLLFSDVIPSPESASNPNPRTRWWLARAAGLLLTLGIAFSAGYQWRGDAVDQPSAGTTGQGEIAPPITGASAGNYFDNLDDFDRDTHNFLRRTRMILMEFTNLGTDSDPTFFRKAAGDLLTEVAGYRAIADRMKNGKMSDLLASVSGILSAIASVEDSNQTQVIADVKATLDLTGLVAILEILDATIERDLVGQPNV
jgi:hypothetical protein